MIERNAAAVLMAGCFLVVALIVACTPTAAPTPSPPEAPAAAPAKVAEATKPPAPTPTPPPAPTATPTPATLKVGFLGVAADAGIFIGMEKGYFKEQGINVEPIVIRTSPEFIPLLSTGQLDVAGMVLGPLLLTAADRGIDLKIVADKGHGSPGFEQVYVVLRKDLADSGQVKTAADLKGMKIAVPSLLSNADQTVASMLQEGGLTVNDVELVVLPFADQLAAHANKAIAASFLAEPSLTRGVQAGLVTKWKPMSSFFGGKVQMTVIVYSPGLAGNPELGRRWMMGYLKGVRDYAKAMTTGQGWDEVVDILVKYTPVKERELYRAMEPAYQDPNGELDKPSMALQYKYYVEKGVYTGKRTFTDLHDPSFAEYVVQKLGKW